MSKVLFVSDVHLTSTSPISRKETNQEYIETQYKKLEFCYKYCIKNKIGFLIYEGDFFNSSTSLEFSQLSDIINLISSYKDEVKSYSIVGNHDLYYRNIDSNKTLLNLMFSTGLLIHLTNLDFDTFTITGVDYNKPIPKLENLDKYNICVAHCFYENSFFGGEGVTNLTFNQASKLGYNAYVLGHDHTYYQPLHEKNFSVYRSGSLLRGTSKTDNLYRGIKVMEFDSNGNNWKEVDVPCKDGENAFLEKRFIEKQHKSINLDQVISNLYSNESNDIYKVIEDNEEEGRKILKDKYDSTIKLIITYLESFGMYNLSSKEKSNDN